MLWSQVKEETARKCFRKAGVVGEDVAIVAFDKVDPFSVAA